MSGEKSGVSDKRKAGFGRGTLCYAIFYAMLCYENEITGTFLQ